MNTDDHFARPHQAPSPATSTPAGDGPFAESDAGLLDDLLALLGEPIRAYPATWSLPEWWEWHARMVQRVHQTRPLPPGSGVPS